MDNVQKLISLDFALRHVASERDAVDSDFDAWDRRHRELDERRQALTRAANDRELVAYELERHRIGGGATTYH